MLSLALVMSAAADDIVPDRPSAGTSASTVGDGVLQIETGLQSDVGSGTTFSLPTLLRYGIGDGLELRLDSAVISVTDLSSDLWAVDVGGLAPALKYTLSSSDAMTLGVMGGAGLPINDAELSPYATFLADISALSINAGWGGGTALYYAVGYTVLLPFESWSTFAETSGTYDIGGSVWDGTVQGGVVWASGDIEADVYAQTSLNGFDAHMFAVGMSYRFGAN